MHCVLDLLAGVEEDISQEPEVADPKCGISIMNIPPNQIHLVGVLDLKSLILHSLPLPLGKNINPYELGWLHGPRGLVLVLKHFSSSIF